MSFIIGALLAIVVCGGATLAGADRDRGFYAAMVAVVASYYDLFAVIGESPTALAFETAVLALFVAAAVIGFRSRPWLLAIALALHGLFDLVHGGLIANPGVPIWWPGFCSGFDLMAGAHLAWRLRRSLAAT